MVSTLVLDWVSKGELRSVDRKRKVLARVIGAVRVWFLVVRMARVEGGRAEMVGGMRRVRGWVRARMRRGRRERRRRMVGGVGWRAVDGEGEDGFGSGCFCFAVSDSKIVLHSTAVYS